jgi:thiol-disulfide isomerase/thioredoxin
MKSLLLSILLLLNIGPAFSSPYQFSIKGKIEGIQTGKFAILTTDKKELLSTEIRNGEFNLTGTLKEPGQYLIQVNENAMYCFLDGTNMTLSGKYRQLKPNELKGSPSNDLYEAYYKMIAERLGNPLNAELANYRAALKIGDSVLADQKMNLLLDLEKQRYVITKEFVENKRDNIFSAYIADVVKDDSYEKGKELYGILSGNAQKSCFGRLLKQHVDELKISALGVISPDFTARSEAGEMVTLSSLRGKILVLDFWASWCGPCIKEMGYLKKLYTEFEKGKIEFVSISLDDSATDWKKAYEKEKIPWISLHEEMTWKDSKIRKLYGINSIPFIVLLDEKGRIITKNLRRDALREKIVELMKLK